MRKPPGSTMVTRTPSGASSPCSASEMPSRANFDAPYKPAAGAVAKPPTEPMFRTCPDRWARNVGRVARKVLSTPNTLTSKRARAALSDVSSIAPTRP